MVSPRKVKFEAEMETESPTSGTITQPDTRKSVAEELQATVAQLLERDRLIIEGELPMVFSDDEDSDDGKLSDSSGHQGEKVNIRSIMQGFRKDSAFYRSADHQCEWFGCQFQSGKQRKFMMHVERHAANVDRDKDGYTCQWQLCDFSAKTRDNFTGHVHYHAYHTKLKVFGARLITSLNIPVCTFDSNHRNKIPNDTDYECAWSGCGMRFNRIMDFGFHVDSHYSDLYANCPRGQKKPRKCQWLGCKFTNRDIHQAKLHGQKHTGPRFIACDNCGHTFVRRNLLVKHCLYTPTEPKPRTRKYKCDEIGCGEEFVRVSAYERHIRTHYDRPLSDYECPFCNKSFFVKGWFSNHLKRKHNVSNSERGRKVVARRVRRRKSSSEEDTSDEGSSEEGSTVDEPVGGTPKNTRAKAEPNERRYSSRTYSSRTSMNHGTPERREVLPRAVKRRKCTNEEEFSDESSIASEPAGGTPKQIITTIEADLDIPENRTKHPARNSRNVTTSVNHGTSERREVVARGAKRRKSTSEDVSSDEGSCGETTIRIKAEPKESRDSSLRERKCKTLRDYFSPAPAEKRRRSELERLNL